MSRQSHSKALFRSDQIRSVAQSCPTLCDPIDSSPQGSTVPGILLARTVEWVAIAFSNAWRWKVKVNSLSCVLLFATPWAAASQAPPSMGSSRQEYWSGVPLPSLKTSYTCKYFHRLIGISIKCTIYIKYIYKTSYNYRYFHRLLWYKYKMYYMIKYIYKTSYTYKYSWALLWNTIKWLGNCLLRLSLGL